MAWGVCPCFAAEVVTDMAAGADAEEAETDCGVGLVVLMMGSVPSFFECDSILRSTTSQALREKQVVVRSAIVGTFRSNCANFE